MALKYISLLKRNFNTTGAFFSKKNSAPALTRQGDRSSGFATTALINYLAYSFQILIDALGCWWGDRWGTRPLPIQRHNNTPSALSSDTRSSQLPPCGRLSRLLYGTLTRALLEFFKASFFPLCFYISLLWFRRTPPPLRQTPSYALV